jgi:hypothetical protein
MKNKKTMSLLRIASLVHRCLSQNHHYDPYPSALDRVAGHLMEVSRLSKRLRICRNRSWSAAEHHQRRVLSQRLTELEAATRQLRNDLAPPATGTPSVRDVLEELHELEREFDDLRYDWQEACIAVTTEPITLQDIALGRFELRLCLSSLATGDPARVLSAIAVEPNPCASDDAVTHPHVSSDCICLGDATTPFQSAIASGRLADALQIARVVLNTYNPSSPFCKLESWYGVLCYDCGYMTNSDGYYTCERCDNAFCEDCYSACTACGDSSCRDCLNTCTSCDESICDECLTCCSRCDQSACMNCLDEGLCSACVDTDDEEENQINESIQTQTEEQEPVTPQPALASA